MKGLKLILQEFDIENFVHISVNFVYVYTTDTNEQTDRHYPSN